MKYKEVSVVVHGIEDEDLSIECICGYDKKPWTFIISIYEDSPTICPKCGRKYYFTNRVHIYVEKPSTKTNRRVVLQSEDVYKPIMTKKIVT